jgi:hypothetical protein
MNKTAFVLLMALAGCGKQGLRVGQATCSYAGKAYHAGASFPAMDGCNTCACTSSGVVDCTLMACLGDAGYAPPAGDDASPDDRTALDPKAGPDAAGDGSGPEATSDLGRPADRPGMDQPDVAAVASPDLRDAARDQAPACVLPDGGPGEFDCYLCTCTDDGHASCLYVGCPTVDANPLCTLSTTVSFGATGGMVAYVDQFRLDPTAGLTVTRIYSGRGSSSVDGATVRTCTPTLPECGAAAVVSLSTIVADLADPQVKAAFALGSAPIYGVDPRPNDGSIWSIALGSGGSISVGAPCPSPVMDSCRPIPASVQQLADDLQSLAAAMVAQTPCWGL